MWADRDRVERRLHALIADFLDERAEAADELDLGVFAIVAELRVRHTSGVAEVLRDRRRPEAEYTPEAEWVEAIAFSSSDGRPWISSGLFRSAMRLADGDNPVYDDESEEPD
jgi:hypothetical protein